ncbi:DUF429 domain-containing protein [Egibacter rhizosphaerae]|uniref:DUF429 domain-containing protein n=1 Tax=Egibacter rhizosphaerae TaxID=1670831 RepID=UPI0013F178B9|nr:DUF429 domain-containing protein [Egibacter rhizosphaerae]
MSSEEREPRWLGIDVGGRRKGFHVAELHPSGRLAFASVRGPRVVSDLADFAQAARPAWVAIDAPAAWAPPEEVSRACERSFARAGICGIRFTPSAAVAAARADRYYEWIEHGLELWAALRTRGVPVIECFPTASWTRWHGPRGPRSRAQWSRAALAQLAAGLDLQGAESATNQDLRDAAAAALTARQAEQGTVEWYGPLVVPDGSDAGAPGGRT